MAELEDAPCMRDVHQGADMLTQEADGFGSARRVDAACHKAGLALEVVHTIWSSVVCELVHFTASEDVLLQHPLDDFCSTESVRVAVAHEGFVSNCLGVDKFSAAAAWLGDCVVLVDGTMADVGGHAGTSIVEKQTDAGLLTILGELSWQGKLVGGEDGVDAL
jgi:hypothetical protein